ncbi:MAG: thymidine phosphorylase, partial [Nanoarchaeota archaeon]|nr:thymidine phosphorylase [Nanoarchaeota archaeon]
PLSIELIKKKLDGKKLTKEEIDQIVWDIVHNKLDDIELSYFVAACYAHELDMEETTFLTKAMASHGIVLKPKKYPVMDKHCVGGVAGNRTTMLLVPIVAAAGLTIPKTSSRSITSPAGTADTMEVLANVSIGIKKMKHIVDNVGGCIVWGGALNLAPADDKIIRVEKPLSIDAKSNLLSSVMAKKASVSATHLLVDIPSGHGSKIIELSRAKSLKKDFQLIARKLGMKVKVIITDGRQPIGNGIGPALEARDVLYVLKNDLRGPVDLREKALCMAGLMLEMGGKAGKGKGYTLAKQILESGKAYDKMVEIIKAQGMKITDPNKIKIGKYSYEYRSPRTGVVREVSNLAISKMARVAGAPKNMGAGVYLHKHVGDRVHKGEPIFTVYAANEIMLGFAKETFVKLDGIKVE